VTDHTVSQLQVSLEEMGNTTAIVRKALASLGAGTANKEIKAHIGKHHPEVPQGQINLILRKIQAEGSEPRRGIGTNQQQLFEAD
jgi:hypothetical protein